MLVVYGREEELDACVVQVLVGRIGKGTGVGDVEVNRGHPQWPHQWK